MPSIPLSIMLLVFQATEWLIAVPLMDSGIQPAAPITAVAFEPEGTRLVALSQAGLQIYRWPELQLERTLPLKAANLKSLAFSPDGTQLAIAGGDPTESGSLEIVSWPDARPVGFLAGHEDSIMDCCWLDGHTMATVSMDRQVKLWNLKTGQAIRHWEGHSRGVLGVAYLPSVKLLISAGIDQSLRVWKLDAKQPLRSLSNHTLMVHALAARANAEGLPMVASASEDRSVRLWQPSIGRMVRFARLDSVPLTVQWLTPVRLVAGCKNGHVYTIDAETAEVLADRPVLDGWIHGLAIHPKDGTLAVAGQGGLRRISLAAVE